MAERLTEYNKTGWALKLDDPQNEFEARQQLMSKFKLACEKLGKLEDILEKYGVESIEELNERLEDVEQYNYETNHQFIDVMAKYGIESIEELECFLDDYSKNQGRYFAICEEMDDLKKDRDTWKRACEEVKNN